MSTMSQHIQEELLLILNVCMCNRQQNIRLKNLSCGSYCDANLKVGNVAIQFLMRFCLQWKISATLDMMNIMNIVLWIG